MLPEQNPEGLRVFTCPSTPVTPAWPASALTFPSWRRESWGLCKGTGHPCPPDGEMEAQWGCEGAGAPVSSVSRPRPRTPSQDLSTSGERLFPASHKPRGSSCLPFSRAHVRLVRNGGGSTPNAPGPQAFARPPPPAGLPILQLHLAGSVCSPHAPVFCTCSQHSGRGPFMHRPGHTFTRPSEGVSLGGSLPSHHPTLLPLGGLPGPPGGKPAPLCGHHTLLSFSVLILLAHPI